MMPCDFPGSLIKGDTASTFLSLFLSPWILFLKPSSMKPSYLEATRMKRLQRNRVSSRAAAISASQLLSLHGTGRRLMSK